MSDNQDEAVTSLIKDRCNLLGVESPVDMIPSLTISTFILLSF